MKESKKLNEYKKSTLVVLFSVVTLLGIAAGLVISGFLWFV